MSMEKLQKQTNINVREKANLIWEIATHLYGEYKPHEYGRVILPMTVIKRFDDCLKDTKEAVLKMVKTLDDRKVEGQARDAILKSTAKYDFYNTSKFTFKSLLGDSENISANFTAYLQGFSDNVKDIIARFEFDKEISKMTENDLLFTIITEFNSKKADMSPSVMTSQDMGYIFEELIRKFSESYDEQAGAHFTSRDIIYLMTELLVAPEKKEIAEKGCNKTAYDMTMGTSQMLACLDEKLKEINENAHLMCFGQEFNPETYAIAKSDMLIKGGNAENMKFGDTLSNDKFEGTTFDFIISNPPFGIDWKKEREAVEKEAKLGYDGRFGPGLPSISDGQLLFMLNGIKKLKKGGRMAIIQNGSSLFTGDAGSGPSEIRKYIIENDMLETIIQLPNDLFYNTGIATYIWLVTKDKPDYRLGTVQLIDASKCYVKRRKNIGSKRVDLDDECINLIMDAYCDYDNGVFKSPANEQIQVESKIFDNAYFGYTKVTVETASKDEKGSYILKKGNKVPVKGATDTEIIPLTDNIDEYFKKNVLPYNPDAFMDRSKDKIGYEIPFTRIFYKFEEPKSSDEIFKEIKGLEAEETELMKELFGND
ncbi:MAG: class I SAM-dependent DNA methyltransferase [bacterium]|nr:class I SAM-dependent DNA methyltransferase [bacterium]